MLADYDQAVKVDMIVKKLTTRMEMVGWPVDLDRMNEVEEQLDDNMVALEEYLVPTIPMKPSDGKWKPVLKPFTKSGKLAKACEYLKQYDESKEWHILVEPEVLGPFCKVAWTPINLKSDKQVKEYLLSIGWKPIEWNIDKKKGKVTSPKLTDESFYSLKSDVGQQIALYLKLSHRKSMVQGFRTQVWYDQNGEARISQVINNMTPTFRATHKGIVNVPGEDAIFGLAIRSIFRAPVKTGKKYVQLGVDAKSCQLRMLCNYMGDPIYTEAVLNGSSKDGTDIHSVNMQKTEGMLTSRTGAKRFIYGFLFGAGDAKLGAILGGNKADGARLRKVFFEQVPSLKVLIDGLKDAVKERGYLVGLDGRKIYVRSPHMLLVYLLQAAEAILMRWALALLYKWGFFSRFDVELVGWIHDEFQFYVAEEQAQEASEWVKGAIAKAGEYIGLKVPSEGDSKCGDTWASTH